MTEPRTPNDPGGENPTGEPGEPGAPEPAAPPTVDGAAAGTESTDNPTQPWPSLTPSSETGPSAASWSTSGVSAEPGRSAEPMPGAPVPWQPADPPVGASPFEPADHLPDTRLGTVGDPAATVAAIAATSAARSSRSRSGLRWGLALLGILVVIGASALIVSLAGGRPSTSIAVGYMPPTTAQYTEMRFDLPGDQRQKLAAYLANFPGFKDQTQLEPKLYEVFDRIVGAVSKGSQTYTANIQPWFGGQIAIGTAAPDPAAPAASGVTPGMAANNVLLVVTISDRAKAAAWLTSTGTGLTRSTYNGADLFTDTTGSAGLTAAAAVTDKVMLGGSIDAVKAAIDSNGQGSLAQDADFKAALAQVDRDYVVFGFVKIRAYTDAIRRMAEKAKPGILDSTQIDETVTSILPTWQVTTSRFENDALTTSMAYPSFGIGYDATNRKSTLLDHVPAKAVFYAETHDIGPALTALLGKFRALPETKAAFDQLDQALSLLGGFDAVVGWWGDAAIVVAPGADGVIGGGLLVQPRDKAAADRLFTTLRGFLVLGGANSGVNIHEEDHNGTPIEILDFSAVPGMASGSLPPGYKAEIAYAITKDVVVLGYGRDFVASVLDAAPGTNLASDTRFKALLSRVGEDNIGVSFVDVNALRGLIEPLVQQAAPADVWTQYQANLKPYLEHVDAVISSVRKDGALDRGQAALTAR
jgi:hypothetical protein